MTRSRPIVKVIAYGCVALVAASVFAVRRWRKDEDSK